MYYERANGHAVRRRRASACCCCRRAQRTTIGSGASPRTCLAAAGHLTRRATSAAGGGAAATTAGARGAAGRLIAARQIAAAAAGREPLSARRGKLDEENEVAAAVVLAYGEGRLVRVTEVGRIVRLLVAAGRATRGRLGRLLPAALGLSERSCEDAAMLLRAGHERRLPLLVERRGRRRTRLSRAMMLLLLVVAGISKAGQVRQLGGDVASDAAPRARRRFARLAAAQLMTLLILRRGIAGGIVEVELLLVPL